MARRRRVIAQPRDRGLLRACGRKGVGAVAGPTVARARPWTCDGRSPGAHANEPRRERRSVLHPHGTCGRGMTPSSMRAERPLLWVVGARAPGSGADASPSRSTSEVRRRPVEQLRGRALGEPYPAPRAPGGCGRAIALARWCSSWRSSSRREFAGSMPLRRRGRAGRYGALLALVSQCLRPNIRAAGARFAAPVRGSSPRPRREGRHRPPSVLPCANVRGRVDRASFRRAAGS